LELPIRKTLEPELYNLELNLPKSKNLPIVFWTHKIKMLSKRVSGKNIVRV
jgi:hypothetical protein